MAALSITAKYKPGRLSDLRIALTKANLSEAAADLFKSCLKQSIIQRASGAGTGNLAESVDKQKRGRYGYSVKADYYFWYANYGRQPGRPPGGSVTKIDRWAENVGWTGKGLREHIREFGTRPKFFFETANVLYNSRKKQIYMKALTTKK